MSYRQGIPFRDTALRLARNHQGQPLVYDEHMELLDPADATAATAVREAEDREWPEPPEWDGGPDALRFPGLYDQVEAGEDDEDEDLDPLDLNSTQPAHAR